jgi:hypothetical protein
VLLGEAGPTELPVAECALYAAPVRTKTRGTGAPTNTDSDSTFQIVSDST